MAYDEEFAERVRELVLARPDATERRMFGGLAFMVGGHMACGVIDDELMVHLEREDVEAALKEPHTRPFDKTGKRMTTFVVVGAEGTAEDSDLARWVDAGADFAASQPPK